MLCFGVVSSTERERYSVLIAAFFNILFFPKLFDFSTGTTLSSYHIQPTVSFPLFRITMLKMMLEVIMVYIGIVYVLNIT